MRRIALGLLAGTGILGLANVALAADREVRKAAPPPPPPVWSWTGFYIGAHLGAGWGSAEWDIVRIHDEGSLLEPGTVIPFASHKMNGFLGGFQAGYNWQAGFVVFGAEAQASWAQIEGDGPCESEQFERFLCRTTTNWLLTFAGRLGFAIDRALLYLKGGIAWANSEHVATQHEAAVISALGPTDEHRFGIVLGAGIEYAFAPNWSVKLEYNYMDFDNELVTLPFRIDGELQGIDVIVDTRHQVHVVKFGVNYLFGPLFGAPAAVQAKY